MGPRRRRDWKQQVMLLHGLELRAVKRLPIAAGPLSNAEALGATGVARILHHAEEVTDSGQWAKLATAASESVGAISVVASHDPFGRAVAPRVAVRLTAGLVAGVTELPENGDRSQKRVFWQGHGRCGRINFKVGLHHYTQRFWNHFRWQWCNNGGVFCGVGCGKRSRQRF